MYFNKITQETKLKIIKMSSAPCIKSPSSQSNNSMDITKDICDPSIYMMDYSQILTLHPSRVKQVQQSYERMICLLNNSTLEKPSNPNIVCSPLHYAVKFEDIDMVKVYLSVADTALSLKNLEGDTALHLAAKLKKYPVVQEILLQDPTGSNAIDNLTNRDGLSHLHIACMTDRHDIVLKLISTDYGNCERAINAPLVQDSKLWPGYTPLHFAVDFGRTDIVKTLIEYGADVCARDARALTPLHLAVRRHSDCIIDVILSNYKDFKENPVDDMGLSHFHIACLGRKSLVVRKFLLHERNVLDINCPVDFQAPIWPGYTPLHLAVESGCYETVNILLEHGADVRAIDKSGSMPLHLACSRCNGEGEASVIRAMIRDKAIQKDSDDELSMDFTDELTAPEVMQWITESDCQRKALRIVELLIEHDETQLDVKDKLGRTPLLRALERDLTVILALVEGHKALRKSLINSMNGIREQLIKMLLRLGADPNVGPYYEVCRTFIFNDHVRVLFELLLVYGYNGNTRLEGGETLFSRALDKNCNDLVAFLMSRKKDAINRIGSQTPIHVTIHELPDRIVNTILISGYDVNTKRKQVANTRQPCRGGSKIPNRIDVLRDIFYWEGNDLEGLQYLLTGDWDVNNQDDWGWTSLHVVCTSMIPKQLELLLNLDGDVNMENDEGFTPLMLYYEEASEMLRYGEREDWQYYRDLNRCYLLLRRHVHILKTLGLYVSEENQLCHSMMCDIELSPSAEEEERLFEERCADEARRLREIRISDRASLHDVLFMSPDQLAVAVGRGGELARVIIDKEFTECGFLLELTYRTAMVRAALLPPARKAMKVLSRQVPIDDCIDVIFQYLDDEDLKDMVRAVNTCLVPPRL